MWSSDARLADVNLLLDVTGTSNVSNLESPHLVKFPLASMDTMYRYQFADARVRAAMHLIRNNPERDWTIAELATAVSLSPSRLRYLFTTQLGIAPIDYLRDERMAQAAQKLRSSHLKVKDIMRQVGIKDSSHFARDFAAKFGASPTRYRLRSSFALAK